LDPFITIMTFTYSSELMVLRAQLEMEGIEVMVKDELTALVNPMYSNAVGGIKLQVRESNVPRAIEILKRVGYINEEELKTPEGMSTLDKIISKLPLPKSKWGEVIWVIILASILAGIAYLIYVNL
jgi:hypothetical protein